MCEVNITPVLKKYIKFAASPCFGLNHLRLFLIAQFTFKSLKGIFRQLQCEMMVRENWSSSLASLNYTFFKNWSQEHFKGGPEKWNFVKRNRGKDIQTSQFYQVINRHKNSVPHTKL